MRGGDSSGEAEQGTAGRTRGTGRNSQGRGKSPRGVNKVTADAKEAQVTTTPTLSVPGRIRDLMLINTVR